MSSLETKPRTVLSRIVEARRVEVARRQRVMPEAVYALPRRRLIHRVIVLPGHSAAAG